MLVIKDKKKFIRGITVLLLSLVIVVILIWSIVSSVILLFTKKEDKEKRLPKWQKIIFGTSVAR